MRRSETAERGPRLAIRYECVSFIALGSMLLPTESRDGFPGLALTGGGDSAVGLAVVAVTCLALWLWERRQPGQSWFGQGAQIGGFERTRPPGPDPVRDEPAPGSVAG